MSLPPLIRDNARWHQVSDLDLQVICTDGRTDDCRLARAIRERQRRRWHARVHTHFIGPKNNEPEPVPAVSPPKTWWQIFCRWLTGVTP